MNNNTALLIETFVWIAMWAAAYVWRKNIFSALSTVGTVVAIVLITGWTAQIAYSVHKMNDEAITVYVDNARTWSHVPLTVVWDDSDFSEYDSGIRESIKFWNNEVGCDLFRAADSGDIPDIVIIPSNGSPCGTNKQFPITNDAEAFALWCPDGTGEIQVQRTDDITTMHKVFVHELGHERGLAHQGSGLMTGGNLGEVSIPLFGDPKSLRSLKIRYCK